MSHAPQTSDSISTKAKGGAQNCRINCCEARREEGAAASISRFGQTQELHDDLPGVRHTFEVHCRRPWICNMYELQGDSQFQVRAPSLGILRPPKRTQLSLQPRQRLQRSSVQSRNQVFLSSPQLANSFVVVTNCVEELWGPERTCEPR